MFTNNVRLLVSIQFHTLRLVAQSFLLGFLKHQKFASPCEKVDQPWNVSAHAYSKINIFTGKNEHIQLFVSKLHTGEIST